MISKNLFFIIIFIYFFQYVTGRILKFFHFWGSYKFPLDLKLHLVQISMDKDKRNRNKKKIHKQKKPSTLKLSQEFKPRRISEKNWFFTLYDFRQRITVIKNLIESKGFTIFGCHSWFHSLKLHWRITYF